MSEVKKSKVPLNKRIGIIGAQSTTTTPYTLPDGTVYNPSAISIKTFKKMRDDDYQIQACLNVLTFTIQKIDWYLMGGKPQVRNHIEYSIKKIWSRLVRSISKGFWAGYSPNTKVFTQDERTGLVIYDKLRDLPPENCRVKETETGAFDGFIQNPGTSNEQDIPADLGFWYAHQMENGNLYGRSVLTAAYKPWYFSSVIHLYANRYYERFAEPLVLGRAPDEDVKDKDGSAKQALEVMQGIISKLKSHESVALPSEVDEKGNSLYDIKYVESMMRGIDFDTYLKRLDMEKARAIFIPDLLLGTGRVGSYELGKEHKATFLTGVMGMIDDVFDYIQLYLIPPLVEINFGTSAEVPELKYLPLSKVSEDMLVDVVIAMVRGGLMKPGAEKLAEKLGIPLEEAEEVVEPKEEELEEPEEEPEEKVENIDEKQFNRVKEQLKVILGSDVSKEAKEKALDKIKLGYMDKFISESKESISDKHKAEVLARKAFLNKEKLVKEIIASGFRKDKTEGDILKDIAKVLN